MKKCAFFQNVERAFGLLLKRFPRLTLLNQKTTKKKIKVILSSCALHNICIMENDSVRSYLRKAKKVSFNHMGNSHSSIVYYIPLLFSLVLFRRRYYTNITVHCKHEGCVFFRSSVLKLFSMPIAFLIVLLWNYKKVMGKNEPKMCEIRPPLIINHAVCCQATVPDSF